ncbi:MAG TPA: BrxA/BrxB family bacilliredoxin [Thermoanaerobaculia bacterium]|jgi:putative YphP/YqiW family bacilliredoxin
MYDPIAIQPFRDELTRAGFAELRTAGDVDAALTTKGTALVVVNSVCGCAAGQARPGVALAARHPKAPEKLLTVFAGVDVEATERARAYFTGYPPSSPSIALLRDGKIVFMLERREIQTMDARHVAAALGAAFEAAASGVEAATAPASLALPAR